MPGRNYQSSTTYKYGHNGQEKDNEIFEGAYSAEYWEYDSRIGRRWERDPIVYEGESPYACFSNNPILLNDPRGLADGTKPKKKKATNTGKRNPNNHTTKKTKNKGSGWETKGKSQPKEKGKSEKKQSEQTPTAKEKAKKSEPIPSNNSSKKESSAIATGALISGVIDQVYGAWKDGQGLVKDKYVTTKGKIKPTFIPSTLEVRSAQAQQHLNLYNKINVRGLGLNVIAIGFGYAQLSNQYKNGGFSKINAVDATEVGIGTIGTVANIMTYFEIGGSTAATVGSTTGFIGLGIGGLKVWYGFYSSIYDMQKFNTPTTNNVDEAQWNQKIQDNGVMNEGDLYGGH